MCPLCLSVAAFVGILVGRVGRARRRKQAPDPTTWRLNVTPD
jgi:hypothetical protein